MMKQVLPRAETPAGRRVTEPGFEMLQCDEVISGQMMGGPQHRFSERDIVRIGGFQGHRFASRGDIERSINIGVPTVIPGKPVQELQLAGKVSLDGRNIQRPRKCLADQLTAPFGVHQGQGKRRRDFHLPARVFVLISETGDRSLRPDSAFDQQGKFEKQLR
jgi:hypothetical protein